MGRKRDEALPLVARRRLKIQLFGFRKRILVFFLCFCLLLGSFVMSLLTGGRLGLAIDAASDAIVSDFLSPMFERLGVLTGSEVVQKLASGLSRFVQMDIIRVVVASMLVAIAVSAAVALASIAVGTYRLWLANRPNVTMADGWQQRYEVYRRL